MVKRWAVILAVLFLGVLCSAKDKKKDTFPDVVLRARYVAVVLDPDSGTSLTNPAEGQIAQSDVEAALRKWGRFKLTLDTANADLILVVHKGGKNVKPTIGGGPRNDHPVIVNPSDTGDVNVGITVGTPPRTSQIGGDTNAGPRPRTEIGSADDVLAVYLGGVEYPLDTAPLLRYVDRNGLRHPNVPAVEKFRKALAEAEKAKP